MNRLMILLLLITISFTGFSRDIVNIWSDHIPENMGVSKDRVWLKSYFLENFEDYSTINTETKSGVLTVVTVSREIYFLLHETFKFKNEYKKDGVIITKEGGIFHFVDTTIQLKFSFSLEKPSTPIFSIINEVYKDDEHNRKLVTDHYLESWVVRIHAAENVMDPDINTLDYYDILITATVIGEKFQWLWGVHDGADYLSKVLKKATP